MAAGDASPVGRIGAGSGLTGGSSLSAVAAGITAGGGWCGGEAGINAGGAAGGVGVGEGLGLGEGVHVGGEDAEGLFADGLGDRFSRCVEIDKLGNPVYVIFQQFRQPFGIIDVEHNEVDAIAIFRLHRRQVSRHCLATGTPIGVELDQGGFVVIQGDGEGGRLGGLLVEIAGAGFLLERKEEGRAEGDRHSGN